MRVPYDNKICELDSFCDDDDEKYGKQHRCVTGELVAQLKCRFCGNRFLPPSSTSSSPLRVFQLPSGHFDDIVDDMVCFEGSMAVPMTAREVTFARKGRLLMGDSFCLLHSSDIHVGTIDTTVLNDAEEYDEQNGEDEREYHIGSIKKMVRCARCNYWLGDVISCQEGSEPTSTEICVDERCGKHCTELFVCIYLFFRLYGMHSSNNPGLAAVFRFSFALTSNSWRTVGREEI